MSLIFDAISNDPQTHILLIAVGGYPFLKGGKTPVVQTHESAKNLGQLTSPGASLAAYYTKIMEYHANGEWSKPLGSVEILFTPCPDSPPVLPELTIEGASLQNIENAYLNWKNRCDKNIENVTLFIFCGHGAEKTDHYLLADDFGQSSLNPWRGAFNFDLTKAAFKSCKAQTQLFFIDACRQITWDMLTADLVIPPIENPSLLVPDSLFNFTIKATATNLAAYGIPNEPTFFTKAILSGLDGLVARKDNNQWLIETGRLSSHINDLMQLVNAPELTKQRCQTVIGGSIDILRRSDAPNAWLEVTCDPDTALPFAELSCQGIAPPVTPVTRSPQPEPWKFTVKAGFYQLAANFQNGGFPNKTQMTFANPPVTREKIPSI